MLLHKDSIVEKANVTSVTIVVKTSIYLVLAFSAITL